MARSLKKGAFIYYKLMKKVDALKWIRQEDCSKDMVTCFNDCTRFCRPHFCGS